jgi:UDP-N-acetylglucosamine transferase subunit ALG13
VIFATVGTQLPFDRLITALDEWQASHPDELIEAQIGPSSLRPIHLRYRSHLPPTEVERLTRECRLVVAHAGMGSVLTALRFRKPIVLVPRKAALGEHRNDHQLATARWLESTPGVRVAWEVEALPELLTLPVNTEAVPEIAPHAQDVLVHRLRDFFAQ